jgi:hypothetical protein
MTYPPDWPRCRCGAPVLDGHLTCGRADCGTQAEAAEVRRRSRLMADELLGIMDRRGPLELQLHPSTVLVLAGLLQLAARHPSLTELHRGAITSILAATRVYFAACPMTLEALRMGDDPAFDVAAPGDRTFELLVVDAMPAIRCRFCDSLSVLPGDIEAHYCARCHLFHDAIAGLRRLVAEHGGTHDCSEWRTARGRCAICSRPVA